MTALVILLYAICAVVTLGLLLGLVYVLIVAYCLAGALWDVWRESRQGRQV